MDFNVLRTVVYGVLAQLETAVLTVVGNVFGSAFTVVAAVQVTAHSGVDVVISLARSALRAIERAVNEAVILAFSIAHATVAAVIGKPTPTFGTPINQVDYAAGFEDGRAGMVPAAPPVPEPNDKLEKVTAA